jgi:crotonobetainyl-CoA:carnitine CoA-transferase CaiB-like acyl-CoA transferase
MFASCRPRAISTDTKVNCFSLDRTAQFRLAAGSTTMNTSRDLLAELWTLVRGDGSALDSLTLSGTEPVLPSSFRVDTAAQVSIAAAGLAAAAIWKARSGRMQPVSVDIRHAAVECRSERYLRVDNQPPPPAWDAIAGVYTTGDGRFVRIHTNFPHHRDNVCKVLACEPERSAVQSALMRWEGEAFEIVAYAGGAVVSLMRSHDAWIATGQARALAALPVMTMEKIGDADPRPWPAGARPLSGLRALDLSRVIAGPVCGRTLAAHGADVLLISSPDLPAIHWLTIDTGRGKRSAFVDLRSERGRTVLRDLLAGADIVSQGYRPQGLASLGVSPQDAATISPGIVYVSLSAYGHVGPWAGRRGFDSLVQTSTGFNAAEGAAAGTDRPKELPVQILDHATGYLMACGAMMARLRQSREGGSWLVQVSLAQTGRWLWDMGRLVQGLATEDLNASAILPFIEESPSGFGTLRAVRHSAILAETPAAWSRPAMPLGSHPPDWTSFG